MSIQRVNLRLVSTAALALATLGVGSVAAVDDAHEALMRTRVPFVENRGQLDRRVAYEARATFGVAFVTRDGKLVYSLPNRGSTGWFLTETFVSGTARPSATIPSKTRVSQFHGLDPANWQTNLPSFEEVELGEVWPGVSVALRAYGGKVEKIYTVGPGTSPDRIQMRMGGAKSLRVDPDRTLIAVTGEGEVRFSAPVAYQEKDGVRSSVEVAYVVSGTRYGFRLSAYDSSLPLVVDPLLQSTYLGGSGEDGILALAVHPTSGEVVVAGLTSSIDFPGTEGGAQTAPGGGDYDSFVARFDAGLTTLLQAIYLGGGGDDGVTSLLIHPTSGEVLVTGLTTSTDFPGVNGGGQAAPGGGSVDGFVARLDGGLTTLLQATYLGGEGEDHSSAIAVDSVSGGVFVAGYTDSADFPETAGGAQGSFAGGSSDAFVARFDPSLQSLDQATYLGGSEGDEAWAMTTDPSSGEMLVAGGTRSANFPGTVGGAQTVPGGGYGDAFVARLGMDLTTLSQSSYLGGNGSDSASGIAIHPRTGEIVVTGDTYSTDFPATAGGAQPGYGGGNADCFVARLTAELTSLLQATYLGGSHGETSSQGLAIRPTNGEIVVAGYTYSPDFPGTSGGVQAAYAGGNGGWVGEDGVVARLDPTLTSLLQATFVGGSGNDGPYGVAIQPTTGDILVAGMTYSPDLPGSTGGAQPAIGGGGFDGFVARLPASLSGAPPLCAQDPETLCLEDARFRVEVAWSVPSQGRSGVGTAVPLTGDTGYFWFFDSANVELVIKALDGVGVNGHYWVFYGALSSVQYTITVTDTVTGAVRTYENPAGTLASVADTSAFGPAGSGVEPPPTSSAEEIERRSAEELYGMYAALTEGVATQKAVSLDVCAPSGATLCLNQSRFQVTVDWEVPSQGRSGRGTAVPVTSDTGYFWFFDSANVELVIKVLDGRPINDHFWVFYGALSNVRYTITVTDTQTGAVRTYENPSGALASVADTEAF